jgi:hypothetical protein
VAHQLDRIQHGPERRTELMRHDRKHILPVQTRHLDLDSSARVPMAVIDGTRVAVGINCM